MADLRHVSVYLRLESLAELRQLSSELHISRSAVIAQAVSRMHRTEGFGKPEPIEVPKKPKKKPVKRVSRARQSARLG